MPAESAGDPTRHPGWYAAGGVLVAAPIFFDSLGNGDSSVLLPLPSPWAALGYRRANDVSWQASFLLVPLYQRNDFLFNQPYALSAVGWDLDRISTNRSSALGFDLRWQVGLRAVGVGLYGVPLPIGIGPHAGLRAERQVGEGFSGYGWSDVGVLPTPANGVPILDFRAEVGFKWQSPSRPGLSFSVGAFNELAAVLGTGFMTPGIKFRLAWNF